MELQELSNEAKLDLFFNTIRAIEPKDPSELYRNGLKTEKYVFDKGVVSQYLDRFKEDKLLVVQSKDTFIITEKGKSFQGYANPTTKIKKSIDAVFILTAVSLIISAASLIISAIGVCYTIAEYNKPINGEIQIDF